MHYIDHHLYGIGYAGLNTKEGIAFYIIDMLGTILSQNEYFEPGAVSIAGNSISTTIGDSALVFSSSIFDGKNLILITDLNRNLQLKKIVSETAFNPVIPEK